MEIFQDMSLSIDILKFLLPIIIAIIVGVYKYLVVDRNSVEHLSKIIIEVITKVSLYLWLLNITTNIYSKTQGVIYTSIFFVWELLYILCKNKSFEIIRYKGKYYRLLKENNKYIKAQGLQEVDDEYQRVISTVNLKTSKKSYGEETLEFNKLKYFIFYLIEGDEIKHYHYYLNRNNDERINQVKRFWKYSLFILCIALYYLKNLSYFHFLNDILPIIYTIFLVAIGIITQLNINVVRVYNKLHIIRTLERFMKS